MIIFLDDNEDTNPIKGIIFECYVDSENLDKVTFDLVKINPSIDWSISRENNGRFRVVLFKKDGFIDYTPNYFE